ncbi:BatD family protein [Thiohalocapsa halophila]|uniref:BatD family protein n=1 Tax=Thiohalocapsa halophila TaxID=69359 RepID=UPI001908201B|nr:BatD family protein [Thiohalocapsa halophila]
MAQTSWVRLFLGVVVLLVCANIAVAQPPYQTWQFRPTEPSNARGVPPRPGMQPSGQPQGQPGSQAQGPGAGSAYGRPAWPGYPPGAPPRQGQAPPGGMPYQQGPAFGRPPSQQPSASPYQGRSYQPAQPSRGGGWYGPRGGLTPGRPQLEVQVSEREPYVQQNVLVRLRVVSAGNLATASPDLAGIEDALFKQLDGPITSTRGAAGNQEIVNEYVLAMTPLRAGPVEIGPLKVSGTLAGGVPFEAVARQPIALDVRPPMPSVRPWLPLRSLRIDAELTEADAMARGRPATLTVELEAEGAAGDQLPSPEAMLRSEDFRVYREQTVTDTRLADSGRNLVGKRIEVYTLVPQSGGRMQLPELRLAWWNVETASREASSVPIRVFDVAGKSGPFGFSAAADSRAGEDWQKYWLPVAGLALLLIGYWGGVWLRGRVPAGERGPVWPRMKRLATAGIGLTGRGLAAAGRALSPRPLLRRLRAAVAALAPPSTRVYQCAKAADAAQDPAAWCQAFQQQACRRLAAEAREPLPRMADRITALRPGADRARVEALMQELDRALYHQGHIDFRRWKRHFRRALRPGVGTLGSLLPGRVHRARLPALNPRPAG